MSELLKVLVRSNTTPVTVRVAFVMSAVVVVESGCTNSKLVASAPERAQPSNVIGLLSPTFLLLYLAIALLESRVTSDVNVSPVRSPKYEIVAVSELLKLLVRSNTTPVTVRVAFVISAVVVAESAPRAVSSS